jgi:glutaminyl-tRNA synthetase
VIHWVDQSNAVEAEIRSYDRLFTISDPSSVDNFDQVINQNSLTTTAAYLEASLAHAEPEARYQFEREGYFIADRYDHSNERPVFNKVIGLRDTWGANA